VKRMLAIALLGSIAAGSACRKVAPSDAAADAAAPAAGAGPAVRVEGIQVLVDGKVAGNTRAIEELGRMQKVDELFELLKANREAFKAANPSKPFPGRATIGVPPETPVLVFKSLFQTAPFAGYPNLTVDLAPGFAPLEATIPAPPEEAFSPRVELHLRLLEAGIEVVEKRGGLAVHDYRLDLPATDAELGDRVRAAVVEHMLRRDMRAVPALEVFVHAENRLPYAKLAAMLRGLRAAHERLAGLGDDDGAFIVRLAVN